MRTPLSIPFIQRYTIISSTRHLSENTTPYAKIIETLNFWTGAFLNSHYFRNRCYVRFCALPRNGSFQNNLVKRPQVLFIIYGMC